MTAGCFQQISTVSTGHCHTEEGLFSVKSVKLARLYAIILLVGRPLSYVLTLHVEEKGGQRRIQGYHSPSPDLMNGWRGGVEAEDK
jgi:hypothetical protein